MENKEEKLKQEINENSPEERLKKAKYRKIKYQIITVIFIIATTCEIIFGIIPIIHKNDNCNKPLTVEGPPVATFNSKFEAFEGDKIRGSNVKQLIKQTYKQNINDEDRQINIVLETINNGNIDLVTKSNQTEPDTSKISSGKFYKVQCVYDDNNGLVTSIIVTEK